MGRFLRSGEFKAKPTVQKEVDRLSGPPQPMPSMVIGTRVSVFCGAGWKKGTVTFRTSKNIGVKLDRENRSTICSDARNIKTI